METTPDSASPKPLVEIREMVEGCYRKVCSHRTREIFRAFERPRPLVVRVRLRYMGGVWLSTHAATAAAATAVSQSGICEAGRSTGGHLVGRSRHFNNFAELIRRLDSPHRSAATVERVASQRF